LPPRLDHAAYIDNWLEVLKRDKKALFTAASKAAAAADYLAWLQPVTVEPLSDAKPVLLPIRTSVIDPILDMRGESDAHG